jgi:hypothetical protein
MINIMFSKKWKKGWDCRFNPTQVVGISSFIYLELKPIILKGFFNHKHFYLHSDTPHGGIVNENTYY